VTNDKRATLCARMLFTRRQLGDIERTRELLGQPSPAPASSAWGHRAEGSRPPSVSMTCAAGGHLVRLLGPQVT
jgi:hypothetical protein